MRKGKKTLSVLLAVILICSVFTNIYAAGIPEETAAENDLLAQYLFNNGGEDSSGNGNHAEIGQGVTVENNIASLPGGTSNSSAYITLPKGMFDEQDNLTISMWLNDKDPRTEWLGAFFFGSETNSSGVPVNYFYFNPCERQHGTLKSVITDSVNSSSPNSTEVGLRNVIDTTSYIGVWTHYTFTLEPGQMNCYINGEKVGTAALTRTVSDFGTGLESYIGKSNYTSDPLYQGDFKDFRVYSKVLGEEEIGQVMLAGMEAEQLLEMAAASLVIPGTENGIAYDDVELPGTIFYDMVQVTWESSDENIMSSDGKIQDIDGEKTITLKAVLKYQEIVKMVSMSLIVLPKGQYAYSIDIDGNNITAELSEDLYGLFFEDINSAADGGLYPEMVKNYSFENMYMSKNVSSDYFKTNGYATIPYYELHWDAAPTSNFSIDDQNGLNESNTHYAVISGNVILKNGGFAPKSSPNAASMAIKPVDKEANAGTYTFSVFAKADEGYSGTMKVKIVDSDGNDITNEAEVPVAANGTWEKISAELVSNVTENTKGKMVLTIDGADTDEEICLDMVSIVPHDSYGYGNRNYAYGVGVRADLVELMMDLNPKFMRFAGGCIVEGYNWEGIYDWRFTVGSLEERHSITNRWEQWGNSNHSWGYMQSFGFGYHEMLTLCDDFGIEPFPILNAGLLCQYETSGVDAKTGEDLQEFIDMATDLLDYCWGTPEDNEWAALRKENGHTEPFDLKYLGIGNENFGAKYFDNFDIIKQAVEEYTATNYPDRELTIISSSGPTSSGTEYEYAYDRLEQTMPGETLVDEHYYESESFMYNQIDRYDYYQRLENGGSEIFVGEYATRNANRFNTALAEAAFITGLERNADIVRHISYAPLFLKIGNTNWDHDLIYFDEFDTAKSTNYYVQQMFGQNYGPQLIGTELSVTGQDYSNYGSPILGTWSTAGYIDKVTIYDANGKILLEDDFEDNSNGWTRFGSAANGVSFHIADSRLYFTGTNGQNTVYLPKAVEEKWTDYTIIVEGAVKTSGEEGFLIGAGYADQHYWYNMGWYSNRGTYMEVIRGGSSKIVGNTYPNRHYNTSQLTQIQTNDPMNITFNFGVNGKLEGSYTSSALPASETDKYNFSGNLNQYQKEIYQVVNMDEENVYIKLVNPDNTEKTLALNFSNLDITEGTQAEITMLTGALNQANAIGSVTVAPEESSQTVENKQLVYTLPSYSVNVIKIPLNQKKDDQLEKALQRLINEIEKAETLTDQLNNYLEQGQQEFQDALKKAKETAQSPSTVDQVNKAASDLRQTRLELRLKPNKERLGELIGQAENYTASDYTEESYNILQQAISYARQIYNDPNALDPDIKDAQNQLINSINGLIKITPEPPEESDKNNQNQTEESGPEGQTNTEESNTETQENTEDPDTGKQDGTEESATDNQDNKKQSDSNDTNSNGKNNTSGKNKVETGDASNHKNIIIIMVGSIILLLGVYLKFQKSR